MFSFTCYLISTKSGSWEKGRKDCRARGADLVVIDNYEEQVLCVCVCVCADNVDCLPCTVHKTCMYWKRVPSFAALYLGFSCVFFLIHQCLAS